MVPIKGSRFFAKCSKKLNNFYKISKNRRRRKMKLMLISVTMLTIMVSVMVVASLSEEEKTSVKVILKRILNDPEFLALDGPKQLHLLIAIYDIVERNDKMFQWWDKQFEAHL